MWVLSILVLISLPWLLLSTFSCRSLVYLLFQNVYSGPLPTLNFFFSIEFYELLVTLDVNSLLDVWSANIFSHLVGCLLILLIVYVALSFLCWFLLCCLCFDAKGQQGSNPLMFSFRWFIVWGLIQVLIPFWVVCIYVV